MGDEPDKPRAGKRQKSLVILLFLLVCVGGGIVIAIPDYFARGALTGRFDRGGIPSATVEDAGRLWLMVGNRVEDRFDISEFRLNRANLRGNAGREAVPALVEPYFVSAKEASEWVDEAAQVIAVRMGNDVRVYPIQLMMGHEAVNDSIGDTPILVAYCIQANLGAVYERTIEGRVHTFGLSGHLYYEWKTWDGRLAFVLWDRETESLWWPPRGKAVSGLMIDAPMPLLDTALWSQTTWGAVIEKYPNARVLSTVQRYGIPENIPRYDTRQEAKARGRVTVAPEWGENGTF